jgi:hypothetical protein
VITRRVFVGGLAGACVAREHLVLEAIAAERMPHRMVVIGVSRAPFFELRDYGVSAADVAGMLNRCGICPAVQHDGRLLLPFESLALREKAWRELSADPEWLAMPGSADLKEVALYRTLSTA